MADASEDGVRRRVLFTRHGLEVHSLPHALEDLPEDARAQAAEIGELPPGATLWQKITDELANAALDSYGQLERVPLLHFLSDYPVTPYTYGVSPVMSRGQRPSPDKLTSLARQGQYRATVNLCAEMTAGDEDLIAKAGLSGELRTWHVPIVDMTPPTVAQMTGILDILTGPETGRTYVHCEAGKGRTGVVTASYRQAVMGWSTDDALAEAKNFGCEVPMQQAFIAEFGARLQAGELGRYPLTPLGSVRPTREELTASVASCARQEDHGPR